MGGESKDFTKRWHRLLKLSFPRYVNIGSQTSQQSTVNAFVSAKNHKPGILIGASLAIKPWFMEREKLDSTIY